jgi:hypothetical protein
MLDLFRTLPGIMNDIEGSELIKESVVFAAWRRIAGESLSDHAAPLRLNDTTLSIAVSNQMWQRQMKDLRPQMVFKINAALGAPLVTSIELRIDEAAVLRERSRWAAVPAVSEDLLRRQAEAELSDELRRAAAGIADDDLRKQFLLAAGNCLVRKKRVTSVGTRIDSDR